MTAAAFAVGDEVRFAAFPGFPMTDGDCPFLGGHLALSVLDPEGVEDWVCELEMRLARQAGGAT